jgi:hypothetical protein
VRELWANGSSSSSRGITADIAAGGAGQPAQQGQQGQPLNLFSDPRGTFSG